MGRIYQQSGSRFLFMDYRDAQGKRHRESTRATDPSEAERVLKVREGKVAEGQPILPRADHVKYDELAADLVKHYETSGKRNLIEAGCRLARLGAFFRGRRAVEIGPALVTVYAEQRQAAGAANGTINREVGVLIRMLRLAYENGKLLRLPVIRKELKESRPRQGFFEPHQYEAVRRRLAPDLQLATAIAYTYGWRMQSEVLALERRQVDLEAGTLRLDAAQTKNDDGRVVYLTSELKSLLAAQLERLRAVERTTGRIIPFLFPYLSGRRRLGERRRDFRKAWATACAAAGVPGRLRHDFRRTAVRDMVNEGTPERVAMMITGHRTRAVFDRYHIVNPADLQAAARRRDWRGDGIVLGIAGGSALETRAVSR